MDSKDQTIKEKEIQKKQQYSDNDSDTQNIQSEDSENEQKISRHNHKEKAQQRNEIINGVKNLQTVQINQNKQNPIQPIVNKEQHLLKHTHKQETNNISSKIQKLKVQSKQQIPNQNDEWKQNQSENDQKQEQKYMEKQENMNEINQDQDQTNFLSQRYHQKTAIYDQDQLNNLISKNNQQNLSILNKCFIDQTTKQHTPLAVHDHNVENKILLLLYLLYRKQIYQIVPRQKRNRIDLHPANRNKIKIFTSNKDEYKYISEKISEIIRKISIIRLNIKPDEAKKMKNSKILGQKLLKRKRIIFAYRNNNERAYYFGGQSTQSQLNVEFKQIKNYKYKYFRIFDYPNTRSYKIILSRIITNQLFLKSLSHFHTIYLQLIQYIPTQNLRQKRQRQKHLCFLMTVNGYLDNVSPKQIEQFIVDYISNNYICVTFVIKRSKSMKFPKLKVDGVDFVYLNQRRFNKSYVYVISHKNNYEKKREDIVKQLEKLNAHNMIYGIRFFKNIPPQRKQFHYNQNYRLFAFPQNKPYSYVITPKSIQNNQNNLEIIMEKGEKLQQKQQFIMRQINQNNQNSQLNSQRIETKKYQNNQRKYYQFNWKAYLPIC